MTVGGLPGVAYDATSISEPPGGQSRLVYLFEGTTEYFINCQSTPENRGAAVEACDGVLATLKSTHGK